MENDPGVRRQRAEQGWHDILREEAELHTGIADHQAAIEEKSGRLREVQDYKAAYKRFHFGQGRGSEPAASFEPGGPCPVPAEELQELEGYQAALRALGTASPGGYVHGRTAGQWLIDAGILEGLSVDEARMWVSKYMARSKDWERVTEQRGWFRYLPEVGSEDIDLPSAGDSRVASQGRVSTDAGTNREKQDFDDSTQLL